MYKQLGKIRSAHGISGEVFLISFSQSFDWLKSRNKARLLIKEKDEKGEWYERAQEFSILKKKPHKVGYLLKLEGIKTRNDAETLKGALFEIKEEELTAEDGFYLFELKDFKVFEGKAFIGTVVGFSSNGVQDLLLVETEDKKIEIPYVKPLVEETKWQEKIIQVNLPDGFLEL